MSHEAPYIIMDAKHGVIIIGWLQQNERFGRISSHMIAVILSKLKAWISHRSLVVKVKLKSMVAKGAM